MEIMERVQAVMLVESEAISKAAQGLDGEQVRAVCEALFACKGKIFTTGCGTSAAAARKISHTLNCVQKPALFLEPSDAFHGGLGVVEQGDCAILFSKGGQTLEMTKLLAPLKTVGCTVIAVTERSDSLLAREADYLLQIAVEREPDAFNMLATASILTILSFFDGVCIAYMEESGFSREQFARIHPEGAVGKRLAQEIGAGRK